MQQRILALIFPAAVCAVTLAGCGGGGGNPGTCFGSVEVCTEGGNPNVAGTPPSGISTTPNNSTPGTGSTTTTTGTTTPGTTTPGTTTPGTTTTGTGTNTTTAGSGAAIGQ